MNNKPLLPAIGWAIVILILCGIPGRDIPHISFLELLSFDKWVHAGIFFILVILLVRGFRLQKRAAYFRRQATFLAAGLAIPYGGLLEIMQGAFFSERSADFYDFVANSFGCFMAIFLYPFIAKKIPKLGLPLHG
jgi:VanZ family protein